MKKYGLTFFYAIMFGSINYLLSNSILLSVQIFILSFFRPTELKFWKTQKGKISARLLAILLTLAFLYITIMVSHVSLIRKLGAWFLLLLLYFVEKNERNFFRYKTSQSHQNL